MINWAISKEDELVIIAIASRTYKELPDYPDPKMTLIMDIEACHLNGCSLDLTGLLNSPTGDFLHDVAGIRKHISRETGKLEEGFVPRSALEQ